MSSLEKIDSRLVVSTAFGRDDIVMHDPRKAPFTLYGVTYENGCYRRMPEAVAKTVSESVSTLSCYTSGGRVAFVTDGDAVAISCKRAGLLRMAHMAHLGAAGFALSIRNDAGKLVFYGSFMPSDNKEGYESIIKFPTKEKRELVIHFPLYNNVTELSIGLPEGATLEKWNGYKREKPIVFYGSSITQGGCASVPGNEYASILSRRFDSDFINLGFSGSAKGEREMMDYLADLDMSMFVYDYDYNAPTLLHLRETHYAGYRTVREKHPNIPILLCTMPGFDRRDPSPDKPSVPERRRNIILSTYARALAEGDRSIYFIDGKKVYAHFNEDGCTVDNVHPNDLGFYRMAEVIGNEIASIWGE